MLITRVEPIMVRIPLSRPVSISTRAITGREYNIVKVHTDEKTVGVGYAQGGILVHRAVEEVLAPLVAGQDPLMIEALWERMFERTLLLGRRGAVMRALSAIDIALWDLKGRVAGLPVHKLLGGFRESVPAYVSTAYYRQGQTPEDVAREVAGCVERGFRAVKMRVGGLPLKEDIARVRAARRAVGDGIDLMVDANYGYDDYLLGIEAGRVFQEEGVRWLEEPTRPDNLKGSAAIAEALSMAVATGESESTRWAFLDLLERRAADILQPDATVAGGISEWVKIAALASAHGLRIAPHSYWAIHIHLAAATPAAFTVEYFERESDIVNFPDIMLNPLKPENGIMRVPDLPGLGIDLDEAAVERFRVA